MLIFSDQDGVLADFEPAFLAEWQNQHPDLPFIPVVDRNVFYVKDQYPAEYKHLVQAIHGAEGFYRALPPVEGAIVALEEMLLKGHEVYILTAPLTSNLYCASEKHAWIQEHLGKSWLKRTIIASDKTVVGAGGIKSILIDDRPKVTGAFMPQWKHVIFDAPCNQEVSGPRLKSWSNWQTDLANMLV